MASRRRRISSFEVVLGIYIVPSSYFSAAVRPAKGQQVLAAVHPAIKGIPCCRE